MKTIKKEIFSKKSAELLAGLKKSSTFALAI
jgi:hypothetical protein